MATSVTVWVRLKDPTPEADRMQSAIPGALPLILRMRSSDATIEEDFVFPYSPREVNIGKLSDEMVQIARPGTTPIVAFKSHSLMTVDFTALIAHPGDGLIQSVDSELFALRRMGSSSDKVFQLLNYDIFTNSPFTFRNMSTERLNGLFFSITDMSIDVQRRNKDNKISMANVKISLVENRNPNINLALIPPLVFSRPNKTCKDQVWAAKHKNRCKKDKKTGKFVPVTNVADAKANATIDAEKAKGKLNCWHAPTNSMRWYNKNDPHKPSPCTPYKPK
jgi:hypothetical protein